MDGADRWLSLAFEHGPEGDGMADHEFSLAALMRPPQEGAPMSTGSAVWDQMQTMADARGRQPTDMAGGLYPDPATELDSLTDPPGLLRVEVGTDGTVTRTEDPSGCAGGGCHI